MLYSKQSAFHAVFKMVVNILSYLLQYFLKYQDSSYDSFNPAYIFSDRSDVVHCVQISCCMAVLILACIYTKNKLYHTLYA